MFQASVSTAVLILFFIALTSAYTSFNTECTIPSEQVHYVSPPNTRGSLTIVWSCLFTIISCTWTVQHPNIPWQREHFDSYWRWVLARYKYSTAWFFVTIIAPEIPLSRHLGDLLYTTPLLKEFNKYSYDGVEWTQTHCLFALMGGFVLRTNVPEHKILHWNCPIPGDTNEGREENGPLTGTNVSSGFTPESQDQDNNSAPPESPDDIQEVVSLDINHQESKSSRSASATNDPVNNDDPEIAAPQTKCATENKLSEYPRLLYPKEILALLRNGKLSRLPDIKKAEIDDKSNTDNLLRLIAIFQILWLIIQVISRAVSDLAVTQLEISTVAFALCAIIMYGLAWNKPKGVDIPITILQVPDSGEGIAHCLLTERTPRNPEIINDSDDFYPDLILKWNARFNNLFKLAEIHAEGAPFRILLGIAFTGVLFGGVHLTAWNSHFPSQVELICWRISALYCTCFPIATPFLFIGGGYTYSIVTDHLDQRTDTKSMILDRTFVAIWAIVLLLSMASVPVYVLARLYLLVEMVRTIAFQPTDAYIGTWTVNLPYFS